MKKIETQLLVEIKSVQIKQSSSRRTCLIIKLTKRDFQFSGFRKRHGDSKIRIELHSGRVELKLKEGNEK